MTSVDHLVRVAEIADTAAPGDPATEWFAAGLAEFMRPMGSRLDEALGLANSGNGRTPVVVWLMHRRDRLLQSAIHRAGGIGPFLETLTAFERTEWPPVQRLDSPPKKWTRQKRELFELLRVGIPIPRGRRRLQQILRACETSSRSGCADLLSLLSVHDSKKMNGARR